MPRTVRSPRGRIAAVAVLLAFAACESDVVVGTMAGAVTPREGGGSADARAAADTGAPRDASREAGGCVVRSCTGRVYACGDCVDDDGDGHVDMDDPDCLGPCHNSEETFFGSIPGQNHATCVEDCYFDRDSGSGNDGCEWTQRCDPLAVAPDYPPGGAACAYDPAATVPHSGRPTDCATASREQDPTCATVCGPLTPNGCDCFGCCTFPGVPRAVWLGSTDAQGNPTCDLAHVADPAGCHPCTQAPACLNPCEECELCVGKRTLPAACGNPGQGALPECKAGTTPCGLGGQAPCPAGTVCITGCCVAVPR